MCMALRALTIIMKMLLILWCSARLSEIWACISVLAVPKTMCLPVDLAVLYWMFMRQLETVSQLYQKTTCLAVNFTVLSQTFMRQFVIVSEL